MQPGTQFLLLEALVGCSAIMMLMLILAAVFVLEAHTPGPVFSAKAIRKQFAEKQPDVATVELAHLQLITEAPQEERVAA